jgi:hypothetical protein
MAADYAVSARVARDWVFGSSTSLLLLIERAETRRWRRIYRVLRDEALRLQPARRCSNWLCALPDGQALAAVIGDESPDVRANFASARLAAGARVTALLRPSVYHDDDVLRCRLLIVDLRSGEKPLNADAHPFYPPPIHDPPREHSEHD